MCRDPVGLGAKRTRTFDAEDVVMSERTGHIYETYRAEGQCPASNN